MNDYREIALKMLKEDEGSRGTPYCDLCGKPWRECMEDRETWLIDIDFVADLGSDFMLREMQEFGICPGGKISIAMGRNLEARPLSDEEIAFLAAGDIKENEIAACNFIGEQRFFQLTTMRQAVLICLAHWGGLESATKFRGLIRLAADTLAMGTYDAAVKAQEYFGLAAIELLWKDGRDTSKGRSGWWKISANRIEAYARIWGEAADEMS